jgi:hypothetical protein
MTSAPTNPRARSPPTGQVRRRVTRRSSFVGQPGRSVSSHHFETTPGNMEGVIHRIVDAASEG